MQITTKIQFSLTLILGGFVVTGAIIYWAIPKDWNDAARQNEDGTYSLQQEWERTIEKKKEKHQMQDLYVLIATKNAYYSCNHCPTGNFFLKKGEVFRYGTTGNGQIGRGFNEGWLNTNLLDYVLVETGDLATIKAKEATLIGSYAILPENLRRPLPGSSSSKPYWYRLVLPPGNNSLD